MRFKMSPTKNSSGVRAGESPKTFFLGLVVVIVLLLIVFGGFSFLINFSAFLGDKKDDFVNNSGDTSLPPLSPRIFLPYEATNSAVIDVSGTAESDTSIELVKDDVLLDTVNTNENGEFVFKNVTLANGHNVFSAVAISSGGKRSELSNDVTVIFDDIPPKINMTNPSEDSLVVDYEDFDIRGEAESDVSVIVNGKVAVVDSDGNFKQKILLRPGVNEIEVKARDLAGNETRKNVTITYDY